MTTVPSNIELKDGSLYMTLTFAEDKETKQQGYAINVVDKLDDNVEFSSTIRCITKGVVELLQNHPEMLFSMGIQALAAEQAPDTLTDKPSDEESEAILKDWTPNTKAN